MPRESGTVATGDWVEEVMAPRRRLLVLAIHHKPGQPAANVELAIEGNPVDRLTLSIHALADAARFRRLDLAAG